MISEETRKLLAEMKNTRHGMSIIKYIEEKRSEVNNVETCNSLEELKGRQLTLRVLDELRNFMTEENKSVNRVKNPYT
jgi:hypothetical protein